MRPGLCLLAERRPQCRSGAGRAAAGWHLRNNLFKYHAACYLTHAPIECAKEIRLKNNFPPERVKQILLRIDSGADKVCNIPHPTTGLEAKFSLRQTVAMALTGVDTAALDSYNEAVTQDPRIKALRDKMAIDFKPNWAHSQAEMAIQLDDGTTIEATHDSGIPWADLASSARRSRPNSRAWSRRCWAQPAPSACTMSSSVSTGWQMWASLARASAK